MDNPLVFYDEENGACPPKYQTEGSVAFDIAVSENTYIGPGFTKVVGTGLKILLPKGQFLMITPRSSLHKLLLDIPNSPGIVDSDYRGEIKLVLRNYSKDNPVYLKPGDRVAQGIIMQSTCFGSLASTAAYNMYEETAAYRDSKDYLSGNTRGEGGFGSTGNN